MEACTSYTPCCVCKHSFSPGVGGATKCVFDGYRRFLNMGSRGRLQRVEYDGEHYEYHDVNSRTKAEIRDDVFVRTAVAFVKQRNAPYLGHKALPLLSRWAGFSWYRMSPPDVMHGMILHVFLMNKCTYLYMPDSSTCCEYEQTQKYFSRCC